MKGFIYGLLIATAIFNGLCAGVYWVAQAKYITECANDSNKGVFNSIVWMANMGTVITGNLMAAFVIGDLSESLFYLIATGLCLFTTVFFFFFIKKPRP